MPSDRDNFGFTDKQTFGNLGSGAFSTPRRKKKRKAKAKKKKK